MSYEFDEDNLDLDDMKDAFMEGYILATVTHSQNWDIKDIDREAEIAWFEYLESFWEE